MFSSRLLSPLRARFVATAATVFALVALGGVVATPAYADAAALRIIDASTGSVWAYGNFVLTSTSGGDTSISTDGSGYYTHFIGDGDYYISSTGSNATVPSDVFNIHIGQTYYDVYVDTYKVSGTIPTDADEGLTGVSVQYYNGTSWGPVGTTVDPGAVYSSDGSFLMRAPQGPGSYRLVFQPDPSTPYTETIVPFTVDGTVSIVALGAVALNQESGISGTVYQADGATGLSGATVHASVAGSDVATGTSDGAGAYNIPLPSGDADYDVWAEAPLYDDSSAQTVPVNATNGYVHTGVDFSLDPTLVTLTGSVFNYFNFGSELRAELYSGGTASPVLLSDTALVGGNYSLTDVPATGAYFIKIVPSGVDAFLPTLIGAGGASAWAKDAASDSDFSVASSFTVDPDVPSTLVHNATISGAAIFRGNFTSYGVPIDGCVTLTEQNTMSSICVVPKSDGSYYFAVPPTGSYKIHAGDSLGEFVEEWYGGADEASATVVGPVTAGQFVDINFSLAPSPATIDVFAHDIGGPDPITVHLYFLDNGEWREASVEDTALGMVTFTTNYHTGVPDGLYAGDYRVRFQDSNGNWIAATTYASGLLPDAAPTPIAGPACYIELPSVTQGRANYVDAAFDIANDTEGCGPQPLNYGDVSGHFETALGVDVAYHTAYLWNDNFGVTSLTNSLGDFDMDLVPNGEFTLELYPDTHVYGDHEYTFSQSGIELTGGDVDLGTFIATLNGNAFGTISNWDDSTMSGATATIYAKVTDPDGDFWEPGPIDVPIQPSGYFEVPGIDVDGDYAVLITFPDTYAPVFLGGGYLEPDSPFTGVGETDYDLGSVAVETNAFVTISGTAFFGTAPLEYGVVLAHPVGGCSCAVFGSAVNPDGTYSIEVAPGVDYEVGAFDAVWSPQLLSQLYSGHNYPSDYTGAYDSDLVEVGSTDITDINFSLIAADEVFVDSYIQSWDESDDSYADFPDVDVHLYKFVVDGWVEQDNVAADSYGYAFLNGLGDGDFRLRFSLNGDWLSIHDVDNALYYPYESDVYDYESFTSEQCYVDLSNVRHGSYFAPDFGLIADPSSSTCGPETLAQHYAITGSVVQTSNFGNAPLAGQVVTLSNTSTLDFYTTTTDASGNFEFDVSTGPYTLGISSFTAGGHSYPAHSQSVTVVGDEALGNIELPRYGNAIVQIDNWDSSMAGATAQLYVSTDGLGLHYNAIGLVDTVDSTGEFVIAGIGVDGEYAVKIDYPVGFVDGFIDAGTALPPNTFAGTAEFDQGGLSATAYVPVTGNVHAGATPVPGASIEIVSNFGDHFFATTDASGNYSAGVPGGQSLDFDIYVTKPGYVSEQSIFSMNFYTPIVMDFAVYAVKFETGVYDDVLGNPTGVVHLYKKVTGGWQEVAVSVGHYASNWVAQAGSYRLRFSSGSTWLPVTNDNWAIQTSSSFDSGTIASNPPLCSIDFDPATSGAVYSDSVFVDATPVAGTCAAEPPVVAPPTPPGSAGHHALPVTSGDEVVPTPTPTPTPSAEPGEDATDEPTDEPDAEKPVTTSHPDFAWAFWLSGILALLVLAGGAVYFVRRRP
jgi:hypothetical protein